MPLLEGIRSLDIVSMGPDAVGEELCKALTRVLIPLSLMDLENYELLPRDWEMLDVIMTRTEEAERAFHGNVLDGPGYIKIGNVHYIRNEFEAALDRYSRAVDISGSAKALKNKGIALVSLKRYDDAEAPLKGSIDSDPEDPEAWFFMAIRWEYKGGERYKNKDAMEKALECYDRALELKGDFDIAFYNKSVLLALLGKKEESMAIVTEWLKKHPASERGWVDRGLLLRSTGDVEGAIKCYDNAIKINPEFDLAYINKAAALFGKERYEEALVAIERAIELKPDSAIAHCNKGALLSSMGRIERSIECYDRALEIEPGFEGAVRNRDQALAQLKEMKRLDAQDNARRKARDETKRKAAERTRATKKRKEGK